ncbi:MAG: DUF4349 domain-containing protein [Oscillospiraceae bacterium]|nr:DUF4349 domain-containing protein [Oscillospiraceae bacterium]
MKQQNRMQRFVPLLLTLMLMFTLLSGCGSSSSSSSSSSIAYDASYSKAEMVTENETADVAEDDGWYMSETVSASGLDTGSANTSTATASALADAKMIYRATLDMETTNFDNVTAILDDLVAELGGYYESSGTDNYGTYRYAYYTVRIPAENFEAFCSQAGTLCQLNSIYRTSENIGEQYYDTESRLLTQQTKLDRLQTLLAQAESMEDIIALESAISETELEIENLTGTLRRYDSLVGYSTVNINLQEVYRLTEQETPAIGFGAKLSAALRSGTTGFVDGLQSLVLSIASAWAAWLIFLLIVAAVVIIVMRRTRRHRRKSPPYPQDEDEAP